MLPNIDLSAYAKFKTNYRRAILRKMPVENVSEIVQLGYLDVCRTLTSIGRDHEQRTSFKQRVVAFINKILIKPPTNQSEFDMRHHRCCQQCIKSVGVAKIHYGQGQKLINMSLKYLYNEFAFYLGRMNKFAYPNTNIEFFFHLPIDNQILAYLVKNYGFCRPPHLPWSKWTYEHYIAFQTELRNRLPPDYKAPEIDYMLWNKEESSIRNAIRRV